MSAIAPKKTQRGSPRRVSWIWWLLLSLMMLAAGLVLSPQQIETRQWSRQDMWGIDRALIRRTLGLPIDQNHYPEKISIEHEGSHHNATVEYTIDHSLQAAVAAKEFADRKLEPFIAAAKARAPLLAKPPS